MKFYGITSILAIILTASSANAALVNFTITGDVLVGSETAHNDYGLTAGDTIKAFGVFDDSALIGGTGTIIFDDMNANTLTISAGSLTLFASNALDYVVDDKTGVNPYLSFTNNQLVDFDYYAHAGQNGAPSGFFSSTLDFTDLGVLDGEWRSSVEVHPVPLPAAPLLFGTGLLALVNIARRRKSN